MQLAGHKILITGGSTGIGLALTRALYQQGNEILICGRDAARLASAKQEMPRLHIIQADIAVTNDLKRVVVEAEEQLGGLSLLINNAAIQFNYDFTQADIDTALQNIQYELQVNLEALMKLSLLCLPLLRQQASAAIVNLSSGLALTPKKSAAVYCATKAGVHIFSKALRYQVKDAGLPIMVTEAILPVVETQMTAGRRKNKMQPQDVATSILRGLERDRKEIYVGLVQVFVWLNYAFPWLTARMMRNA